MRRWHSIILPLLACILIPCISFAQYNKGNIDSARINSQIPNWKDKSYYAQQRAPKTVIVKLNGKHLQALSDYGQHKDFHDYLTQIHCYERNQAFPGSKKPEKAYDHLNRKLADLSNIYVLRYSDDVSIDSVILKLKRMDYFEYVEPKFIYRTSYIPNDPEAQPVTGIQNFYLYQMQVYEAWNVEQGNPSVVIGIVDTGMDLTHPELTNNVTGWDVADNDPDVSSSNGHGITVSGCASATVNNNEGGVGISFNSPFMPIKAAPDMASGSINYGYEGLYFAVDNGCAVINLSWG